jgi:hypothetical protein
VRFVADRVSVGRVFLQVLQFFPVNVIPLPYSVIYNVGDGQRARYGAVFTKT